MMTGVEQIANERARQGIVEGFDAAHDDKHDQEELVLAACAYAAASINQFRPPQLKLDEHLPPHPMWPWAKRDWKPSSDKVRNLVKAGALIAAEIDRLQRLPSEPQNVTELPSPTEPKPE
jgi:hypothetical protein